MRRDVLSLIVGWTMVALMVPLIFSFTITWWLDGFNIALRAFFIPTVFSGVIGGGLLTIGVRSDTTQRLRDREAFAAVALAWPVAVFVGALPYWFGGVFNGPFTNDIQFVDILRGGVNSWFESMSGFTTTGATVISPSMSPNCVAGLTVDCINAQPKGLLIWRSLTQWLGGMGIIVLSVALLPALGAGGYRMLKAEAPGGAVYERDKPRITDTAKELWWLYILLSFFAFA